LAAVIAGVFPYFCVFHPGMIGAVAVNANIAAGAAVVPAARGGEGASSSIAWLFGGGLCVLILLLGAAYLVERRQPAEVAPGATV
jgi:hypothetical protein